MGNLVENGKGACAFGAGNFARLAAVFVFCVLVFSLPAQASVIVRASQLNSSSNLYVGNGSFFVNVSNGYAGVGTTGPERPLHVVAAQDANIRLQDTSGSGPAAYIEFYNDTARWGYIGLAGHDDKLTIATALDKNISFYTNNTPRMTLTAAGNLGLGTTSPWNLLHVAGITAITESTANYGLTFVPSASLQKIYSNYGNSGGDTPLVLGTYANQANQVYLATSGKVGIGNSSPSYKLDVAGTVNAYALYLNGSPLSTSQWTTSGSDVYYSAGNVGIGSIAPAAKLHVNSSWGSVGDTPMVLFSTTYAPGYGDGDMLKVSSAGSRSDAYLLNLSNSVGPKFVVMADGKVGVGTSSPSSLLTLYQSALNTANGIRIIGSQGLDSLYLYGSADNVATIESKIDAGQTAGTLLLNPSGGNIGIGTTSPGAKLHVVTASASAPISSAADELVVENSEIAGITIASGNTSNGNLFFADSNLNGVGRLVYDHSANAMSLWTDSTQRMTISSTGNVGIGTTSPEEMLEVRKDAEGNGGFIQINNKGGTTIAKKGIRFGDAYNNNGASIEVSNIIGDWFYPTMSFKLRYSHGSDTLTERMTILSTGYVGIGTASPTAKLSVNGTNQFHINPDYGGYQEIPAGVNLYSQTRGISILPNELDGQGLTLNYQGSNGNYYSALEYVNPASGGYTNLLLMKSGGNVGIGTTTPQRRLDVESRSDASALRVGPYEGTAYGLHIWYDSSTGADYFDQRYNNVGGDMYFRTKTAGTAINALTIQAGGNVGIGTTTPSYTLTVAGTAWVTSGAWSGSDARWKKNVTSLSPSTSLGKVLALRPVNFDWRTGEFPEMNFINGTQVGFIAQEVEKIIPEVVTTDDKGFKGMSYERLTPVLTSAVQEQEKKIEAQQAQIEQLKALVCQDHQSADVCN